MSAGAGGARPLEGVVVVTLEHAVAAPFATRQLADLGARVIKVERPGVGDFARGYDETVRGTSSVFFWLNRSKESLTLDVKHPRAPELLDRLLERADVFVQNLAPGAAQRLGLGGDELLARHPRLVVCNISGFGDAGPYRDRKAYDLLIQGEAGVISVTGTEDVPSKVGISVADIAGGMYGFSGILAALLQRSRTGRGDVLDISLFDALIEWMGHPLYYTEYGGTQPVRMGTAHPIIAPYGAFATQEGDEILVAVQNEREWRAFCTVVLGDPAAASDPSWSTMSGRVADRTALDAMIGDRFAQLGSGEALRLLDEASIASARVNQLRDVARHPQLVDRDRWQDVATPFGPVPGLLPTGLPRGASPRMDPVPALGEHTEQVVEWLGFSAEDRAAMRADGLFE
ncbi:CaiB/BaiF CoA transferase family protein [Blastococcus tunisiensis]|uniref:Crotonobetainyl-CoA:carnitine CoA-transferase CaiB n=1 Tax=Blastococcus tunisiensis TaxID=1798228 RepID=A0A1I1ZM93_9ACTN|nr:CaiB/BaiF CoA-transferase family protein [Blastococcus sp. DSM 46838]SFE32811.1 Crotonobetainyl-CoA:carnitine CoA-transferase CaiB [Blastococcus sp. DSM 46838]